MLVGIWRYLSRYEYFQNIITYTVFNYCDVDFVIICLVVEYYISLCKNIKVPNVWYKMQTESIETSAIERVNYSKETFFMGCVKWFNNKKGYGYVTIKNGELDGEDIFTHHSTIQTGEGKYRYLVAGEYVHIKVKDYEGDSHLYQAQEVKAPCDSGVLMCEYRASRTPKEA